MGIKLLDQQGGYKMAGSFVDTNVVVSSVTDTTVKFTFAGSTVDIPKERLRQLMSGEIDPTDFVVYNIATTLALSGVNIQDDVAIKREVERRAFKMFR